MPQQGLRTRSRKPIAPMAGSSSSRSIRFEELEKIVRVTRKAQEPDRCASGCACRPSIRSWHWLRSASRRPRDHGACCSRHAMPPLRSASAYQCRAAGDDPEGLCQAWTARSSPRSSTAAVTVDVIEFGGGISRRSIGHGPSAAGAVISTRSTRTFREPAVSYSSELLGEPFRAHVRRLPLADRGRFGAPRCELSHNDGAYGGIVDAAHIAGASRSSSLSASSDSRAN